MGGRGAPRPAWHGWREPLPEGNWPILAASPIPYFPYSQVPREMDRREQDAARDDFVRAAPMAGGGGIARAEIHFPPRDLPGRVISPAPNPPTHRESGVVRP